MGKNTIDIKKPAVNWKKEAIFFLGLATLVAAVGGFFLYGHKTKKVEERSKLFVSQNIDPSFFDTVDPPLPPKPEPKPEPIAVEIPIVYEEVKAPPLPPPLPPKPRPEDLFNFRKLPPVTNAHKKVNNRRRGVVEISVKTPLSETSKPLINEVAGKWEEPKTKASLPIDMTRVLTEDRLISAILIPEIDSELGGKVTAQIENNVFGAHGRKILIPAGTKAVGRYKPIKKIGQERITVMWSRLITPDGINIHVGKAEMTDSMGRAGITGDVDKRYGERYGISLLVSLFTAATTYSLPVKNENQQVVIESFGKEQSSLAKSILEEHLEIKPKVTIPVASRILISPAQDIWFKELKDNEIVIVPVEG